MEQFGWCFIGTGHLARQVAQQILASGRHKIVSCYTRNIDNAQAFAGEFGGQAYARPEDAICASGVEGVYIVTTHNVHFRFAKLSVFVLLCISIIGMHLHRKILPGIDELDQNRNLSV